MRSCEGVAREERMGRGWALVGDHVCVPGLVCGVFPGVRRSTAGAAKCGEAAGNARELGCVLWMGGGPPLVSPGDEVKTAGARRRVLGSTSAPLVHTHRPSVFATSCSRRRSPLLVRPPRSAISLTRSLPPLLSVRVPCSKLHAHVRWVPTRPPALYKLSRTTASASTPSLSTCSPSSPSSLRPVCFAGLSTS